MLLTRGVFSYKCWLRPCLSLVLCMCFLFFGFPAAAAGHLLCCCCWARLEFQSWAVVAAAAAAVGPSIRNCDNVRWRQSFRGAQKEWPVGEPTFPATSHILHTQSPIPIPISHILAHRRLSAVCQCDGGQRAYLHLAATKLCFICICGSSCYSHAQGVHLAYMFIYLRRCCGHFDRWAPSANEQQLIKPWTLLTATIFQYICAGIRENRDIPGGLVANPMASDLSVSSWLMPRHDNEVLTWTRALALVYVLMPIWLMPKAKAKPLEALPKTKFGKSILWTTEWQ